MERGSWDARKQPFMNFMNNGYFRAICLKGSRQPLQICLFLLALVVNVQYFSRGWVWKHSHDESIIITFTLGEGQLL